MIMIQRTNITSDEIINQKLTHVDREASVLEASKLMRKAGTTELLVTVEANGVLRPLGILTAKDIVTRVIATELDPAVLTTGDIAGPGLAAADCGVDAAESLRRVQDSRCEALAVLDAAGRFVGTVRRDEIAGPLGFQRNLVF
jgi:predicted transcriptional regulator